MRKRVYMRESDIRREWEKVSKRAREIERERYTDRQRETGGKVGERRESEYMLAGEREREREREIERERERQREREREREKEREKER